MSMETASIAQHCKCLHLSAIGTPSAPHWPKRRTSRTTPIFGILTHCSAPRVSEQMIEEMTKTITRALQQKESSAQKELLQRLAEIEAKITELKPWWKALVKYSSALSWR